MRKGTVPIFLGLLLIAAALGITVYNFYDSWRAEASAKSVLAQLMPQIEEPEDVVTEAPTHAGGEIRYADYVLNPNMPMPVKNVEGNDYIGVLSVPRLDMELPVLGEWSYENLKVTVCRYSGSVYLDSMVLCAHNYMGLFGQIRNLNIGDLVDFTDMDGNEFHYEVMEVETVVPSAVHDMTTGGWDMTLFTCTTGAQARIAVRCRTVEEE